MRLTKAVGVGCITVRSSPGVFLVCSAQVPLFFLGGGGLFVNIFCRHERKESNHWLLSLAVPSVSTGQTQRVRVCVCMCVYVCVCSGQFWPDSVGGGEGGGGGGL